MLALSAGAAAKKGSVSHIMPCAQSANAACHTMRDAVRNTEMWRRRRALTRDPSTDLRQNPELGFGFETAFAVTLLPFPCCDKIFGDCFEIKYDFCYYLSWGKTPF